MAGLLTFRLVSGIRRKGGKRGLDTKSDLGSSIGKKLSLFSRK